MLQATPVVAIVATHHEVRKDPLRPVLVARYMHPAACIAPAVEALPTAGVATTLALRPSTSPTRGQGKEAGFAADGSSSSSTPMRGQGEGAGFAANGSSTR